MNPLVSIVIPSYNAGKTIRAALDSIFLQAFTNFEVVVVDGRSTDNTLEILEQYAVAHKNLRFVSESDKGIYDAMNKSIKLAVGEWLLFLGSDDRLYNDKVLKSIFGTGNKPEVDVIYGNVFSTRFNGLYDGEFNHAKILEKNICHQAIFFNRRVFAKIGGFNLKYKAHADWEHNIRWFFNSSIKRKYIDLTISHYADGGFSSVTSDDSFLLDKDEIFLRHAFRHLDRKQRIYSIKSVIYRRLHSSRFFRIFLNIYKQLSAR